MAHSKCCLPLLRHRSVRLVIGGKGIRITLGVLDRLLASVYRAREGCAVRVPLIELRRTVLQDHTLGGGKDRLALPGPMVIRAPLRASP